MLSRISSVLNWGTQAVTNVARKARLFAIGLLHMLLSQDKKFKPLIDPGRIRVSPDASVKRIVFIRHGESEWNEVFNRGFGPSFIVRLVRALIREMIFLTSRDSVFFDSPLSETGIRQTQELIKFLQRAPPTDGSRDPRATEIVMALRGGGGGDPGSGGSIASGGNGGGGGGDTATVVLGTSNLRRAIVTGLVVLWERLRRTREKFFVLSSLQEITFNIDGVSLLEAGEVPDGELAKEMGAEVAFSGEFNGGTKGLGSNGYKRMLEFSEWASGRPEAVVVVTGHSLYFRAYFQSFLPFDTPHAAKERKMVNCGVVAFSLVKGTAVIGGKSRPAYKIEPGSVVEVYGGFEAEKKNGKKKLA